MLVNTNLKDSTIKPIVIVLSSISIFIGSSISTIKIRKNGILYGGLVGAIYIVLIYLLSSIAFAGFSLNLSSLVMIISSIMTGVVGGVIGVNIK